MHRSQTIVNSGLTTITFIVHTLQAVEDLRNELMGKIADLRSRLSTVQGEQLRRMDDIVQMQSGIRNDMLEIRTNMQFLSESVSALILSTMEEILKRLSGSSKDVHEGHAPEVSEKPGEVSKNEVILSLNYPRFYFKLCLVLIFKHLTWDRVRTLKVRVRWFRIKVLIYNSVFNLLRSTWVLISHKLKRKIRFNQK